MEAVSKGRYYSQSSEIFREPSPNPKYGDHYIASRISSNSSSSSSSGSHWTIGFLPLYPRMTFARVTLALVLLLILTLVIIDVFTTGYCLLFTSWYIDQILNRYNIPTMSIVMICATAVANVIPFPSTLLTLAGGYLFAHVCYYWAAVLLATMVSTLGSLIGAFICYRVSTSTYRGTFADFSSSSLEEESGNKSSSKGSSSSSSRDNSNSAILYGIERALSVKALQINLLLRLSPLIPNVALNYLLGPLGSPELDFLAGCFFGVIPYAFVLSMIGAATKSLSSVRQMALNLPAYFIIPTVIFGLLFLAWASWTFYRYANQEINLAIRDTTSSSFSPASSSSASSPPRSTGSSSFSSSSPSMVNAKVKAKSPTKASFLSAAGDEDLEHHHDHEEQQPILQGTRGGKKANYNGLGNLR